MDARVPTTFVALMLLTVAAVSAVAGDHVPYSATGGLELAWSAARSS